MQNFTSENLLRFFYKETTPSQSLQLIKLMENNLGIKEKFLSLSKSIEPLSKINLEPNAKTLDNIFKYSKKSVAELATTA